MPMPIIYEEYRSIVITEDDLEAWYQSIVGPWYFNDGVFNWKCRQIERGPVARYKSM